MIRKIFKYISVFSLWLAVITLSAHQIIPHDHHLTDTFLKQDNNCPASKSNSSHKSGFPLHCHAFNVFTAEKFQTFHVPHNIQFIFISPGNLSDACAFKPQISCVSILGLPDPVVDLHTLDSSQLRAPPALA